MDAGYYQPPSQPQFQPQPMSQPMPMSMQPMPQQQTIVITGQPQPSGIVQNTRQWSHGICSCCEDLGECTCVHCLSTVLYACLSVKRHRDTVYCDAE